MPQTDLDEILNLNETYVLHTDKVVSLSDRQLYRVSDLNNGQYSGGANFDTLTQAQFLTDYSKSYFGIPLAIASTSWTGSIPNDRIAFRGMGTLGLIQGITLTEKFHGKTLIANGNQIWYYNQLRLLFQKTKDWLDGGEGQQYLVNVPSRVYDGADIGPVTVGTSFIGTQAHVFNPITSPSTYYISTTTSSTFTGQDETTQLLAGTGVGTLSPALEYNGANAQIGQSNLSTTNAGFDKQQKDFAKIFKWNANSGGTGVGAYEGIVYIKASEIHPLLAEMNFPIKNVRWYLTLNIACTQFASSIPFLLTPLTTNPVTVRIGNSLQNNCTWYMEALTLPPSQNAKFAEQLRKGIKFQKIYKEIQPLFSQLNQAVSNGVNLTISNSVTCPAEIMIMLPPTGYANATNNAAGGSMASSLNMFPCLPSVSTIKSMNVFINNQQYLNTSLLNTGEAWFYGADKMLQYDPLQGGSCGLLQYGAFSQYLQMPVFDVSRPKDLQRDPMIPVTCSVQLTLNANQSVANIDVIGVLTNFRTAEFTFTDTNVDISYIDGCKYDM